MADFRTSTQRDRWIFQSHDLVSPGAQGLLSYALSRSRRLSDLLTIRRARALMLCFADGEVGGGKPAGCSDPCAGWVALLPLSSRIYLISSFG